MVMVNKDKDTTNIDELLISSLSIDNLIEKEKAFNIAKQHVINKSLGSDDPNVLIKASQVIEKYEESDRKSMLIDSVNFAMGAGFKEKPTRMGYEILSRMSRQNVIYSIIKTRVNQIASFCEKQKTRYDIGFKITKKRKYGQSGEIKMTKKDLYETDRISDILLNCGSVNNFSHDDFDAFTRMTIFDSLVYDQMTFETVTNRKGVPIELWAVAGNSIRIADTFDEENNSLNQRQKQKLLGYTPSYVQVYQNSIINEYYPWELCFAVRNPSSDLRLRGYGESELEVLITTVTSLLWSDEYNRRFFSQGASPKGILKVNGTMNASKLQEFRQHWLSSVAGVGNAWKTPIIEADKVEWIDLQKSNTDMEWSKWTEFLIKIACACYTIDPSEIGFPMSGASDSKPMFEGNNEARLKYSRDKGLYPLLKFYGSKLNKYFISRINPDFQLEFCGMNGMTVGEEVEINIKKVSNIQTLNEVREEAGLSSLGENGDIVLNSIFLQNLQANKQAQSDASVQDQQSNETQSEGGDSEENPFLKALNF